ncbi:class I SAM-dependent methyltransferase [Aggregatimonas sangjinii]|uniref:Class I SAM-dependent methyltransferase n=1 Tax=Aggregatimonas sangjinii TaxID=2583587 RepID=A0A5B7SYK3_9FLAO|nr:class I SAM-dependent methyltransferase [Aggregatimonas sangjinii]QCX01880.1 class I SAM-dependent methyltransferase [Aggregatimonas sangjinii]
MKSYLKTKDHSVSGEHFELLFDADLELLVTHPQPKDLGKYYESESYISHTDSSTSLIDKIYQIVKRYSLSKKGRLISQYAKNEKTLLDFGAGTGDFLLTAKNENWTVTGVEPHIGARAKSSEKGIALLEDISEIKSGKFEVITLWHVLEHLPDLNKQIEALVGKLEQEGTLIIAVPNFKSHDARHYKNFWAAYDVPRHLWHFSKKAIEKLFEPHDMKIIAVRPMLFDAFYVSLLSEKYKTGRQNYLKAFYRGLFSNMKAMRSKEHSSLIYILQKA